MKTGPGRGETRPGPLNRRDPYASIGLSNQDRQSVGHATRGELPVSRPPYRQPTLPAVERAIQRLQPIVAAGLSTDGHRHVNFCETSPAETKAAVLADCVPSLAGDFTSGNRADPPGGMDAPAGPLEGAV